MKGYPITLNIYAENEAEVEQARKALVAFISQHAQQGRAVTGKKIAEAVSRWDKNPFVKNQIINFLK
jgi:hypothetical protein